MANPFIPYYIILDRSVLPEQLTYPQGILLSPSDAAAQYNANIVYAVGSGVPPPNNFSPRIGVPPLPAASLLSIGVTSATFSAGFTVDQDGVQQIQSSSLGGTIEWRGYFFTEIPNATADRDTIQTRYWIDGFELPILGDGGSGDAGEKAKFTRAASRTLDGFGFALRGQSPGEKVHVGSGNFDIWERFYFRINRLSSTGISWIWNSHNSAHGTEALVAGITPSGNLEFYSLGNQVFPGSLLGTLTPPFNTWCRLDLTVRFRTGIDTSGGISAYLTAPLGTTSFFATGGGSGLQSIGTHANSAIGTSRTIANTGEVDVDDWCGYSFPLLFRYDGLDWVSGSHVRSITATGYGPMHGGSWSGDYRVLAGIPIFGQSASDSVSTSATDTLDVVTNYADYKLGCVALNVAYFNNAQGSAGTSNLGYNANGATSANAITAAQSQWRTQLFSLGGVVTPTPLGTVDLIYQKNSTGNESVQALQGTAEFLGSFGPEDDPTQLWPPRQGTHNAPYWDQSIGQSFVRPTSPVSVMGGTYIGNGTGQDITVTTPIHWFWCRPLTGNTGGAHWWSSMYAGHDQTSRLPTDNRFIQVFRTPSSGTTSGTYTIQVSGANTQCNANGVVYQWVGFSDLGMRYLLNGAAIHKAADTSYVNPLADPSFLPEAAFIVAEETTGASNAHLYKGTGHGTDTASPITTSVASTIATFGTGALTTLASDLNAEGRSIAYSCWRANDGISTGAVAITNYTGDGLGNRTITVALGNRFPFFALVVPHNGISYFRDPSFTGTISQQVDGTASASTGIRGGGTNQLLVGSALNTNAIVYDVFVLPGDTTGPNWSPNPPSIGPPIFPVPTVVPTGTGAFGPTDTKGWWLSANGFGGSAALITTPLNPKHPRTWSKIAAFAAGTSGMLGGSPGAGVTYNNHLIYAGDDYTVGTDNPPIRIFDGLSDRLLVTAPGVANTPAKAIMSMILVGTTCYFTTLDSGSSASDFAGRVFALDILSANVVQVGGGFSGGEVPYTLVYHMGRLWLGTNKGNGTAGTVYFFRPGIDTTWSTDHTLSTDSAGGACSMASYKGTLYVGCDAASGSGAKILARTGVGTWSTSHTAATTAQNNGHLSMLVFENNLYTGYWNNTSTSLVKQFDGTTWTSVYTGAGVTIRPYIGMFISDDVLYVVGGGNGLAASLVSTEDGLIWSDNTPFLTGPLTETALPIFGVIGV